MKFILSALLFLILSGFCFAQNSMVCFPQSSMTDFSKRIELQKALKVNLQLQKLQEQKILAEAKRKILLTRYTEEYSKVKEIELEIESIQSQIKLVETFMDEYEESIKEPIELIIEINDLRTKLQKCDSLIEDDGCRSGETKRKLIEAYKNAIKNPDALNFILEELVENLDRSSNQLESSEKKLLNVSEQNAEKLQLIITKNQKL